ncbi:MAG: hypothetical protein ACRDGT_11260 [Candidatus Limnocylindria bacterium]
MREFLEGRRIGFALRPPLGAVALGLGIGVTLLDLMSWFAWGSRETNGFVIGAYWLAGGTAFVALLATVTALVELGDVLEEDRTLARLDVAAAAVATVLYAVTAALRSFDLGTAAPLPLAFLMAIAGLLVLMVGAVTSSLLYAAREWEEAVEITHERHRRRRMVAR